MASCAIFMAGVAVVTLRGKIRLVGEIWTGERLGMKSNVPGSKMVQVKGVMLLMQPTPLKTPTGKAVREKKSAYFLEKLKNFLYLVQKKTPIQGIFRKKK